MAAVGSAFGKLILFGEHAAVFGHPAIGVQLTERTTVTIHGAPAGKWDLEEVPPEDRQTVQRLIDKLEALLPHLAPSGKAAIHIESSVPRGIGMGSSAALCSAMAAAFLNLSDGGEPDGSLARTWRLAHDLETIFHGTPSGIDTGLSLLKGITAFSPQPPALPRWERLRCAPLWLVVAALPRSGDCAALVRNIGDRMRGGDQDVREALSILGKIAADARQELTSGGSAALVGRLADRAMEVLTHLGLGHPLLERLLDEGRQSGALGGKLSGAGGGGAFFLICADAAAAGETTVRLRKAASRSRIKLVALPRPLCIES
ncbi:MAG: hypothetical protein ABSG38_07920 [Spirochaetia bacterium]|jgi:mevalonate kinase